MNRPIWPRWCGTIAASLLTCLAARGALGAQAPRSVDRSREPSWIEAYRDPANRLINEATKDHFAWQRLAALTDVAGNRLSGSSGLDRAIKWAVEEMKHDGLENVHTEAVTVPKWVRGAESAEILEPLPHRLAMLGLGGSAATPPTGIQAPVLIVRSYDDLEAHGAQARGRIVVLNIAYSSYTETVRFRNDGASRASAHGAIAVLVRSIGPDGLRLPHTGAVQYSPGPPEIPAAAIASEDADRLQRMADRGERIVVRLKMESHFEADAPSANVVGELRGRERPNEIVLVSGHLDSWDVGDGASDDGGGCIVAWEALRMMKKLNLRPRRTLRLVLWTNEENGIRGGRAYRDQHRAELARHVLLIESDSGVARPLGFGFTGSEQARQTVRTISTLLSDIGAMRLLLGGEGADIAPSVAEGKIPAMSLDVDASRYFLYHHTEADTVDKIDPAEMARCAAAIAVMSYVVAEMPDRLGG
jgi:carboxypeptidase Q